ncbi:VirB3 family type IV secretion system protein [Henriciella aquimarina]|uniref:VirB3 family type IV secretion system protein n=1 Tax=Henriciella aquimarina TaxID=545261 RepID=UPI0009FF29CA|nr:VirB3 family type IV secretion system protein [Henriciella aquimarina]
MEGYEIPLHRSLTEPILMAGAPRAAAIAIGTLAAALALGLRLWIPGLLLWVLGHSAAVFIARADPDFMAVAARSIRHREHLSC